MTLYRKLLVAAVVGPFAHGAIGDAQEPCTDCPTPPPCSAEGGCYPKQETWGHYHNSWRRWPGDYDAADVPEGEKSVLPQAIIPPATEEDRAAPAPSESQEEEPSDNLGTGTRDFELPSLPPIPGGPGMQPAPGNNQAPGGGLFEDDMPPGLPPLPGFGTPPGISPPPGMGAPPSTSVPARPRPQARTKPAADEPPPLPAGFATLIGAMPAVTQASHTQVSGPAASTASPTYYQAPR